MKNILNTSVTIRKRVANERIEKLAKNEIFVFGSNLAGKHGAGAALKAAQDFGAKYNIGFGLMGQSYALPTCDKYIRPLSIVEIANWIEFFLRDAAGHRDKKFLVTAVGCGLGGYKAEQIGPLFKDAIFINNVYLPEVFWYQLIKQMSNK